jgi:hypothetical protein
LTVSIGVCTADPDCYLTDREVQEMANKAKEKAKGPAGTRSRRTWATFSVTTTSKWFGPPSCDRAANSFQPVSDSGRGCSVTARRTSWVSGSGADRE